MNKLKDFLLHRFAHFLDGIDSPKTEICSIFAQLKSRRIPNLPCQTSVEETLKDSEQYSRLNLEKDSWDITKGNLHLLRWTLNKAKIKTYETMKWANDKRKYIKQKMFIDSCFLLVRPEFDHFEHPLLLEDPTLKNVLTIAFCW